LTLTFLSHPTACSAASTPWFSARAGAGSPLGDLARGVRGAVGGRGRCW